MIDDINDIKRDHLKRLLGRRVIIVVEDGNGFLVEQWAPDSVWPYTTYRTRRETGARVLQLLGLKDDPIYPQSWPEEAEFK